MNTFYTYCHVKPNGSIFYIGKGMGDRAWSKENRNIHWKRTVDKYGYEVDVLAQWNTEKEAFEHEKFLILCFKKMGYKLVNMTNGGEGSAGYKWTDEQKANINVSGDKNPMFNKKHSVETKNKISAKAKSRIIRDETKAKISKSLKNRMFSKEHLDKLRIAAIGNNRGIGNKGSPKKCCIDGVVYASTLEASNAIGITANAIQKRCKNDKYQNYIYI